MKDSRLWLYDYERCAPAHSDGIGVRGAVDGGECVGVRGTVDAEGSIGVRSAVDREESIGDRRHGVLGIDEAGRGSWVGPVVAAAVYIVPEAYRDVRLRHGCALVDDSKKLSREQRELLFLQIANWQAAGLLRVAAGQAQVAEIEAYNVVGATALAMRRAVAALGLPCKLPAGECLKVGGKRPLAKTMTTTVSEDCVQTDLFDSAEPLPVVTGRRTAAMAESRTPSQLAGTSPCVAPTDKASGVAQPLGAEPCGASSGVASPLSAEPCGTSSGMASSLGAEPCGTSSGVSLSLGAEPGGASSGVPLSPSVEPYGTSSGVASPLGVESPAAREPRGSIILPPQVWVDGNPMPKRLSFAHTGIIAGDGTSLAIAIASIWAKVTRDRLLAQMAHEFPHYGWQTNAGYGTAAHVEALRAHGACCHHRPKFLRKSGLWPSK